MSALHGRRRCGRIEPTPRLPNPRRAVVCEADNCNDHSTIQVVNIADNRTMWFCPRCAEELCARARYWRAAL